MINVDDRLLGEVNEKEFWLLVHIAKRLDKTRGAFPSNETLLNDTGWSDKTLRSVKKSCVEKGLLRIEKRMTEDGKQTSNNYRITTNRIGFFIGAADAQGRGGKNYQGRQKLPGSPRQKLPGSPPVKITTLSINQSEVLTNEPERENAPAKIETDYTNTVNHLLSFFETDGAAHLEAMRDATGYRGKMKEPLTAYCRKLQEDGEFFRLRVPADAGKHYTWFARMRGGIERYMSGAKRFGKDTASPVRPISGIPAWAQGQRASAEEFDAVLAKIQKR